MRRRPFVGHGRPVRPESLTYLIAGVISSWYQTVCLTETTGAADASGRSECMDMLEGPLVFVDIDTQRDFLEESGALYVPGSRAIVPNLERLSRLAAARYAPDGIRINVLAPGLIDTPMAARAAGDPAIRHFLQTKQPLRAGPGLPDDCSGAAVFLCSDEARFITGVVLPVDGGWSVSEGQAAADAREDA